MPIYEYQCLQCGSLKEIIHKVNEPPQMNCDKCGGPLKKVISPPAIQFRGSGWYVTDYAQKSKAEATAGSETKPAEGKESAAKPKGTKEAKTSSD